MAWEENSCICLHMQLIAILSRIGVYNQKFIKLLAKEMVKEMQKVKDETKEPELITVKEAAETLNLSEAYVRKIKDKLPHVKQGNNKQGRILFVKEGLMDAYLNAVGKAK